LQSPEANDSHLRATSALPTESATHDAGTAGPSGPERVPANRCSAVALGALLLVLPLLVPSAAEPVDEPAKLPVLQAEVAAELAKLNAAPESTTRDARIQHLRELEQIYVAHTEAQARSEKLAGELAEAREKSRLPPVDSIGGPPPYSLSLLDATRLRLASARAEDREARTVLEDARSAVAAAKEHEEEISRARRLALEELEDAPVGTKIGFSERVERLSEELRIANADLALKRQMLANARTSLELTEALIEHAKSDQDWVESQIEASPEDLAAELQEIEARGFSLDSRLSAAKLELQAAQARFDALQRRLVGQQVPEPALAEQAKTRQIEVSAQQGRVTLLGRQLIDLETWREVWTHRYAVAGEQTPHAQLVEWQDQAEAALLELGREDRQRQVRIGELEDQIQEVERELASRDDANIRPWLERRTEAFRDLAQLYQEDREKLAELERQQRLLLADLAPRVRRFDASERFREIVDHLGAAWDYEIVSSEDNPVTVGKVVAALLFFLVGYLVSRVVAHTLARRVLPKMRIEEGTAAAYESLVFYVLLVGAFLVALQVVNIPLTVFAIAGGALAIGVGFGSQNIMNNFISGIILLAERPIKLHDLVELADVYGTVEQIGLRSTRVRTGQNVHIIVPNSALLENQVINWTHNNAKVRIKVTVGVIYGSPTETVAQLLKQAAAEHPSVHPSPEPLILFTDFGDNSLVFEVHFWIQMRNLMDRRRTESELRFRIDALFREAGLVIAFPQRDVHLDSASPIEVRMVAENSAPTDGSTEEPERDTGR